MPAEGEPTSSCGGAPKNEPAYPRPGAPAYETGPSGIRHQVLCFYFVFRIENLVPLLQTQNFSRLRRWVRCLSPPQGHITRRSIFTFLGLRARTLHFGAERYSDSCCLYGVCGLKSFCFFCSKSAQRNPEE